MASAVRNVPVPAEPEGQARIGEEGEFVGKFSGGDLTVNGRLEGDLKLTGWLRVGRNGRVSAKVQAGSVEINGQFEGELRASLIVFGESARAQGAFLSARIQMKEGARVDGSFDRWEEPKPPAPVIKPAASVAPAAAPGPGQVAKPAAASMAPVPGKVGSAAPGGEVKPGA